MNYDSKHNFSATLFALLSLASLWLPVTDAAAQELQESPLAVQILPIDELFSLIIRADGENDPPARITAKQLPQDAVLLRNLDGSRTFMWIPQEQDIGETTIRVTVTDASDPDISATYPIHFEIAREASAAVLKPEENTIRDVGADTAATVVESAETSPANKVDTVAEADVVAEAAVEAQAAIEAQAEELAAARAEAKAAADAQAEELSAAEAEAEDLAAAEAEAEDLAAVEAETEELAAAEAEAEELATAEAEAEELAAAEAQVEELMAAEAEELAAAEAQAEELAAARAETQATTEAQVEELAAARAATDASANEENAIDATSDGLTPQLSVPSGDIFAYVDQELSVALEHRSDAERPISVTGLNLPAAAVLEPSATGHTLRWTPRLNDVGATAVIVVASDETNPAATTVRRLNIVIRRDP